MKFPFLFSFCLLTFICFSQSDNTQAPFKRFPGLPPVKILLSDSTSWYTKDMVPTKKNVLYIIFSPECSHCQHETEELIKHQEDFRNVQIIMVTMQPLFEMNQFILKYKLNELTNIVVGKDVFYTTPTFYNIHNLPYLAMYDETGNLITSFEGTLPIDKILETFHIQKK